MQKWKMQEVEDCVDAVEIKLLHNFVPQNAVITSSYKFIILLVSCIEVWETFVDDKGRVEWLCLTFVQLCSFTK